LPCVVVSSPTNGKTSGSIEVALKMFYPQICRTPPEMLPLKCSREPFLDYIRRKV